MVSSTELIGGAALLGVLTTGASAKVIAAPPSIDQTGGGVDLPAAGSVAAPSTATDVFFIILLALAPLAVGIFAYRRLDRLPARSLRPDSFTPLGGAGLCVAILAANIAGVQAARLALLPEASVGADATFTLRELSILRIGGYLAQSVIVAGLVYLYVTTPSPREDRRVGVGRSLLVGLAGLALVWPVVTACNYGASFLWSLFVDQPVEPIAHETLQLLVQDAGATWWWVMVGLVVVGAPIFEEILYRGVIQQTLRQVGLPPWIAIAAASALFVLTHVGAVDAHALPALFVLSMGFGWVFEKTGRLAASMSMHALFNLGNVLLAPGP